LLRAQIEFASRRGNRAAPLLLAAARELATLDPGRARATYLEALSAAMFAGRLGDVDGLAKISESALVGPPPTGKPRPSDLLLQGWRCRSRRDMRLAPHCSKGRWTPSRARRTCTERCPVAVVCQLGRFVHVGRQRLDGCSHDTSSSRAGRVRSRHSRLLLAPAPPSTRSLANSEQQHSSRRSTERPVKPRGLRLTPSLVWESPL
jgi:hypothetical protein